MRASPSQMMALASLSARVSGESSALCSTFQDSACSNGAPGKSVEQSKQGPAGGTGVNGGWRQVLRTRPHRYLRWCNRLHCLSRRSPALQKRRAAQPRCLQAAVRLSTGRFCVISNHLTVVDFQDHITSLSRDVDHICTVHPLVKLDI